MSLTSAYLTQAFPGETKPKSISMSSLGVSSSGDRCLKVPIKLGEVARGGPIICLENTPFFGRRF